MMDAETIAPLLPKQVLYQAELCPDPTKMLGLQGFLSQPPASGKAGQAEQAGNIATIRRRRPEIVPKLKRGRSGDLVGPEMPRGLVPPVRRPGGLVECVRIDG